MDREREEMSGKIEWAEREEQENVKERKKKKRARTENEEIEDGE